MKTKTKRNVYSWILLAVFVPMVLLSSLHIHNTSSVEEPACAECVQHQCHGHLTQLTTTFHECVLCHFVSLAYVAAAVAIVALLPQQVSSFYAQQQRHITIGARGVCSMRAPPFV